MARPGWVLLAVVCFAAFGAFRLLHAVPLLVSSGLSSLVPFALFIQGLIAVLAAISLFRRTPHSALLVVLLGVAVGVTALLESFAWGVRAPLAGLLICVVAVLAAVVFARFLRAERLA